jgi:hypothetical protein
MTAPLIREDREMLEPCDSDLICYHGNLMVLSFCFVFLPTSLKGGGGSNLKSLSAVAFDDKLIVEHLAILDS